MICLAVIVYISDSEAVSFRRRISSRRRNISRRRRNISRRRRTAGDSEARLFEDSKVGGDSEALTTLEIQDIGSNRWSNRRSNRPELMYRSNRRTTLGDSEAGITTPYSRISSRRQYQKDTPVRPVLIGTQQMTSNDSVNSTGLESRVNTLKKQYLDMLPRYRELGFKLRILQAQFSLAKLKQQEHGIDVNTLAAFGAEGLTNDPRRKKKTKLPIERDGIIADNPEKFYTFGDEIGRGKLSVVKHCTHKRTGTKFAAKMIKFDSSTLKYAVREFDFMTKTNMNHPGLVKLHDAYLVRKYLILIVDFAEGKTILDKVGDKHSLTEDDVAGLVKQLLQVLAHLHSQHAAHLDVRPTNIRISPDKKLKLLDYNSAQFVTRKGREVADTIGDTEFCAPEMLSFNPVKPASDMWSVGVLVYTMLSGTSPFYNEDERKVVTSVEKVKWQFDEDAFEDVTGEAKDFIKKIFVRAPENRITAEQALKHPWFDDSRKKKRIYIKKQEEIRETDERLLAEEEENYVHASLVLRTFEEEEYESPEESDNE